VDDVKVSLIDPFDHFSTRGNGQARSIDGHKHGHGQNNKQKEPSAQATRYGIGG
jgi:hypothetical protein